MRTILSIHLVRSFKLQKRYFSLSLINSKRSLKIHKTHSHLVTKEKKEKLGSCNV